MKNSSMAAVLVALVLIAAACSDGSDTEESASLAPNAAELSDADGNRTASLITNHNVGSHVNLTRCVDTW